MLILGSGNVVHNLGMLNWSQPDAGMDWARRFDDDAAAMLMSNPAAIATLNSHADFCRAVPTPDHFIPLLHLAGLDAAASERPQMLVDGYAYGSLSMVSYAIGARPVPSGARARQDWSCRIPADESNI